jgi:hypothetical protein
MDKGLARSAKRGGVEGDAGVAGGGGRPSLRGAGFRADGSTARRGTMRRVVLRETRVDGGADDGDQLETPNGVF